MGYGVIVDYVWGRPTEALLDFMTRKEFANVKSETRLVQVGESAGTNPFSGPLASHLATS